MDIRIYNRKISSIQIDVETPYEMRGLYILLQLITCEEFKHVINGMGTFDGLPGLGKYCRDDVSQNPIRRLYELLRGNEEQKPSKEDVCAIVTACKKAIRTYNKKLLDFFASDLMDITADLKLPTSLLIKATSKSKPLTQTEFMSDSHIKWAKLLKPSWKQNLYDLYKAYENLITGFAPIDRSRAPNITGLIDAFNELSLEIAQDEYIHNDDIRVDGIGIKWNETHIQPTLFGSLAGIATGVTVAAAKSTYDIILRPLMTVNGVILTVAIDNSINLLSLLTTLVSSRKGTQYKQLSDTSLMILAVQSLAEKLPEYKKLLIEKGFQFTTNEINYIDNVTVIESADNEAAAAASTISEQALIATPDTTLLQQSKMS